MILSPYVPCDVSTAEWRINTNPISHRFLRPNRLSSKNIGRRSVRAWIPRTQKNWAWLESWDRSVSNTGKIYEKIVLLESREQFRLGSWRWRTTKNAGFTTVHAKSRRTMNPLECQSHEGKHVALLEEREQVQGVLEANFRKRLDIKFASGNRVHLWNLLHCFSFGSEETGKSIQGFCFQTRWPVKLVKISSWRQWRSFAQSKQNLNTWDRKHQVGSLNSCINELLRQAHAQCPQNRHP